MTPELWLALPGIIGLLATIIKIIADWRKGKAEATGIIVDSATDVVLLLRGELKETRAEIKALREEIKVLRARLARLILQIRAMGAIPDNGEA
jgi:hypothetical protein